MNGVVVTTSGTPFEETRNTMTVKNGFITGGWCQGERENRIQEATRSSSRWQCHHSRNLVRATFQTAGQSREDPVSEYCPGLTRYFFATQHGVLVWRILSFLNSWIHEFIGSLYA